MEHGKTGTMVHGGSSNFEIEAKLHWAERNIEAKLEKNYSLKSGCAVEQIK